MNKAEVGSELADDTFHSVERVRLDKLAIGLSVLCLVHCLSVPLLLLAAPALGMLLEVTESSVHWTLLALALPISLYALWQGFRHHGQRNALLIGSAGLVLMLLAVTHVAEAGLEAPLTVAGVLVLLGAHVLNLRHGARCCHVH